MPIYDTRNSDFTFDKAGFDSLKMLPQYKVKGVKQRVDLPPESLVVVAYTANIYGVPCSSMLGALNDLDMTPESTSGSGDACPTLSLNIQFVILVGHLQD